MNPNFTVKIKVLFCHCKLFLQFSFLTTFCDLICLTVAMKAGTCFIIY